MKRKSCEGCIYYRPYSRSNNGEWGCHYLFDTDQKRGCPVEGCTKKKVGVAKRRTDPFDGTIGRRSMTREFLERYQGILADIAAIKADKVTDTVSASSAEFPYSQHTVTVQGVPADWRSQRLSELYRDKAQIELYIESVEDDTVRAIMRYRIKQGLPWGQVAARMGYSLSEQQIKRRYYGAFEK